MPILVSCEQFVLHVFISQTLVIIGNKHISCIHDVAECSVACAFEEHYLCIYVAHDLMV
jgi:hypothetical protein